MINALVSAVLQVGAVLLVAALVHVLFGRRQGSLARSLGLRPTPLRAAGVAALFGLATAALLLLFPAVRDMAAGEHSVAGEAARGGVTLPVVAILAIKALVQTSLSEELLFRGLIGRRLIAALGFHAGNALQAALFGAMHLLVLFIPQASAPMVAAVVAFTGLGGWVNGWLNERIGGGSILPGWIAHGLTNLAAYLGSVLLA